MIAVRVSDEIPVVTVAAPSYIARHGRPQTPHELAKHDCIRIRFGSGALISWRLRLNRRVVDVPVEGRFIVNDDRMAMQAVVEGAGLLQMPRTSVERELAAKRLVTVLDDFQQPPLAGFFLYYPSRRQIRPALKVLVAFLRKRDRRPRNRRPRRPRRRSGALDVGQCLARLAFAASGPMASPSK